MKRVDMRMSVAEVLMPLQMLCKEELPKEGALSSVFDPLPEPPSGLDDGPQNLSNLFILSQNVMMMLRSSS
jgi:hypothetical protein